MKASTLIATQIISLIIMIGSADNLITETLPTILFTLSFVAFASCSIYISKHNKSIIRDTNNYFERKRRLAGEAK